MYLSNIVHFLYRSTKYGIYKPNCGIENLQMIWGHDEYLYRFLIHNKSKLPEEAHWMIRYVRSWSSMVRS